MEFLCTDILICDILENTEIKVKWIEKAGKYVRFKIQQSGE